MPIEDTAVIVLGLVCGIAFIVTIGVIIDAYGIHVPTTPSHFLRIAGKLPETQEFLNNYPDSNSTFWRNNFLEYWSQKGDRFASLRIQINPENGEPRFIQLSCVVTSDDGDSIEIHGLRLVGITGFLQEAHCPETPPFKD